MASTYSSWLVRFCYNLIVFFYDCTPLETTAITAIVQLLRFFFKNKTEFFFLHLNLRNTEVDQNTPVFSVDFTTLYVLFTFGIFSGLYLIRWFSIGLIHPANLDIKCWVYCRSSKNQIPVKEQQLLFLYSLSNYLSLSLSLCLLVICLVLLTIFALHSSPALCFCGRLIAIPFLAQISPLDNGERFWLHWASHTLDEFSPSADVMYGADVNRANKKWRWNKNTKQTNMRKSWKIIFIFNSIEVLHALPFVKSRSNWRVLINCNHVFFCSYFHQKRWFQVWFFYFHFSLNFCWTKNLCFFSVIKKKIHSLVRSSWFCNNINIE